MRCAPTDIWIRASPRRGRLPDQGWKLHVSAGPGPRDVLRRCLTVLASEDVHFKVIRSAALLLELSAGVGGASQVGKFLTVYPRSAGQAVSLAAALDAATAGCQGPSIPSDRALRPGSVVHYRFGSFTHRRVTTWLGTIEPAVRAPDGRDVAARARPFYDQPAWVRDPFRDPASDHQPTATTIAGRFVPLRLLATSPRGRTWLALDLVALRRCVLKEALPWVVLGRDGSDARDRLAHEAAILGAVEPLRIAPRPLGLFRDDGVTYLAMEDIAGETLEVDAARGFLRNGPPSGRSLATLGVRVASALEKLHGLGLVHRDIKPSNVVFDGREQRLLDFELCLPAGAAPAWGTGTVGYVSPRRRGASSAVCSSDDVYSLGALLAFAATGRSPSPASNGRCASWLSTLNPAIPPSVLDVILRCLDRESERRPTASDVAAMLRASASPARSVHLPSGRSSSALEHPRHLGGLAGLGVIRRRLSRSMEGELRAWLARGCPPPLHLNDGAAGAVLVLTQVQHDHPTDERATLLRDASCGLIAAVRAAPRPRLAGLCVGEGGVAAAVMRAGALLEDAVLASWARRRAEWALREPSPSPDYFHGLAGSVSLGMQVADRWRLPRLEHLLRSRARELAGRCRDGTWHIPEAYGGLGGQAYYGAAHGTAGIGRVLLAMFLRTGDVALRDAVSICAERLRREKLTTLNGRGATWPVGDRDSTVPGPFWCHGAAGVGAFFLDLWSANRDASMLDTAVAAAHSVVETGRWLGPTRCHGLAGNVEFLLDLHAATRDDVWRDRAMDLGGLLAIQASTTHLAPLGLGLFTGLSGVLAAVLRLLDPARRLELLGADLLPPPRASTARSDDARRRPAASRQT